MSIKNSLSVSRVVDQSLRAQAMAVLRATYHMEKHWVSDEAKVFPPEDLSNEAVSWFVVRDNDAPVGVLRVLYEPPLDLYRQYGFKPVQPGMDIEAFLARFRIAEIGRFAVIPEFRNNLLVVVALMRAAATETVQRGYTHYITDVFEGETHSPYQFHSRVMGFQAIATHDVGELNCPNRRITMILDLAAGYNRIRKSQRWIYRYLTEGWDESLHQKLRKMSEDSSMSGFPIPAII